ncbi:perlucin-like protein [Mytilus galloprovincialis]|uniref:perlucin-like protein n=1 Tax=Mytilus galloprovincialis TaxID=29158 RepID=UPI003F7C75E1
MNQQGKNYTGKINKTRFGQKCQAWKSLAPNKHPFAVKLADDEDYCRNPDTELYGPWCYTTDPGTRWEYCNVPYCEGADNPSKDNWKYGWQGFEDSYYSIQYTEKSWVDAKDFCKTNLGAYLAEITTPEENDFLMNLLPKPTADNSIEVWLGARDLKREREFTWDNSATYLDYTDWGPNEPNGDDWYFEDCLATHLYRDGKLHWNDRSCAARIFFVCEKR